MKIRISRLFLLLIFLTVTLFYVSGCAQQMKSVQSEPLVEPSGNAEIKSILFPDDASKIEINTDRPVVYTYYMLDKPPRLIVDLAQTTSGTLILPIEVNKGNVKRVDVAKHEFGKGVLSRIDITLKDNVEVAASHDGKDKNKLVFTLQGSGAHGSAETALNTAPGTAAAAAVVAEIPPASAAAATAGIPATPAPGITDTPAAEKPAVSTEPGKEAPATPAVVAESAPAIVAPQVEPQIQAKPEPQAMPETQARPKILPAGSPRSLTAITKGAESIDIEISSPVESFKTFKLSQPERLVIDIANTKNLIASRQVEINKFNLGKARIGGTAEKLRVVFDAAGGSISPYHVVKADNGLQILFGETPRKAAETQAEKRIIPEPVIEKAAVAAAPESQPASAPIAKEQAAAETAAPAAAPVMVAAPLSSPAGTSQAAEVKPVSKPALNPSVTAGSVDAIEFSQADGLSVITINTSGTCSVSPPVKSAKALQLILKD